MPRPERAVDPAEGSVAQFAIGLRELRQAAGNPTYRVLAQRAHYSAATLAAAAGGKSLPSLSVALAYVRACDGDVVEWERRWRDTAAELEPQPTNDGASDCRSPYVGLAAYGPEDAECFCGRDRLIAALLERVGRQRFVAVVGASGSGKSSLLRAGLVPAVSADRPGWRTLVLTPGPYPLRECAVRVGTWLGLSAGTLVTEFGEHSRNLGLALRQLLAERPDDAEFLLVVDQFEEVFTLCHDAAERELFIAALLEAADAADSRTRVVIGLRSDFYTHCARHPRLAEMLQDAQVLVGPMRADELTNAITQPAARAKLMVEKALVTTVVHDAATRPGALPFVSHALWETWRRRRGNGLVLDGYRAAGGVNGAIALTTDHLYQNLDGQRQRVVREIFLRLTALGEGTEDTRRRVARDELLDTPDREVVASVLDELAAARLVTLDADTVEIAHEALIHGWPTLREWLADDREALRAHRRLTEAAAEWERHGRDDGLLYRGARLTAWQDRVRDGLNDVEHAFLTASRLAADRETRRRRGRVRWMISGLSTATVIVTVFALFALLMARRADDERALAVSRQLIADARAQLQRDPELGLLLAREAYAAAPDDDTEAVLRQAVAASHLRATLYGHKDPQGRPTTVVGAAFTQDGRHLAVITGDMQFDIWDWKSGDVAGVASQTLRNPDSAGLGLSPAFTAPRDIVSSERDSKAQTELMALFNTDNPIVTLAFSLDRQRVAAADQNGVIAIRDPGGRWDTVKGHDGPVRDMAFSHDGRRLVSCGDDGTVRIWDLVGGANPVVLRSHTQWTNVTFSPTGDNVASVAADGTVEVWDATGAAEPYVIGTPDGGAHSVVYSPDGHAIVTAGYDGTVRVWNADHRADPVVLRGHRGFVVAAMFSPDGKSVVSVGADGTAKVWDVDAVEDVTVLRGHQGPVHAVTTSPDGRRATSGGQDGTVRVWDTTGDDPPIVLPGTDHRPVSQVTFSRDARRLAAVDQDGTVFVWDITNPAEPARLRNATDRILRVAFSPNGEQLAAVNRNAVVWVWNLSEINRTTSPTLLIGYDNPLFEVAWSSDGRHIAAVARDWGRGIDASVILWDLRTLSTPTVLPDPPRQVNNLTFSPDGRYLAGSGPDDTFSVWNMTTTVPTVFRRGQGVDGTVAFGSDGRDLVITGYDGSVRIWDMGSTAEPLVLDGFRAQALDVAPLSDDRYVSAHTDGTIRIWRCPACGPIDEVLDTAGDHVTRDLTPDERRTYLPVAH